MVIIIPAISIIEYCVEIFTLMKGMGTEKSLFGAKFWSKL